MLNLTYEVVVKEVRIDTRGIRIEENSTSDLLIYDRSGGKELRFLKKASEILFEDIFPDYLKARFFLISPVDYEVLIDLVKRLYGLNRILIMDAGGFGGASSSRNTISVKERQSFLKGVAKYFHCIKIGKEDCQHIFGRGSIYEEVATNFVKWGCKISIITRGGDGALVVTESDKFYVPAFTVKVTDPTGAGDVFTSGFIAEYYLKKNDIRKSVLFASAVSSLVIEKTGGVSFSRMPTASDVYNRLNEKKELI